MSNILSVSIMADITDFQVKATQARVTARALNRDLEQMARTANISGWSDELRAGAMSTADALVRAQNEAALYRQRIRELIPAVDGVSHASAGVTRELLVMGRELGRGDMNRMAGSATILAGRLGLLTPTVLSTALGIAGIVAPLAAVAIAAEQGSREVAKFQNAMEATNGYAGVTISQIQHMSDEMATWAHTSIHAASDELTALAASGRFTGQTIALLGADAVRMAQLTGEGADKFNTEFEKMGAGVAKFAREYNERHHQLTLAQIEYIQHLEEIGQTETAQYQVAKDIYDYLGRQAPANLGYLERAWNNVSTAISNAWENLKAFGRDSNADQVHALDSRIDMLKRLHPNGIDPGVNEMVAGLERQKKQIEDRESAEQRSRKAQAETARTQQEGVAAATKLHEQFEASRSSGEKLRVKIAEINQELAKSIKANPGNRTQYELEAAAARADAQKSLTPKAAGGGRARSAGAESPMTAMEEELRRSEFAIKQETGDWSKDMQDFEAKFWEGKLAEAAKGSKLYGAIMARLQQAQLAAGERAAQQQRQIADSNASTALSVKKADIGDRRSAVNAGFDRSIESQQTQAAIDAAEQKRDALRQLAQEEANDEIAAVQAKAAMRANDVVATAESANQIKVIEANLRAQLDEYDRQYTADHEREVNKRKEMDAKAARENEKNWRNANTEILSAESQLVQGVLTGRQTMGQLLLGIGANLVQHEIENDLRYLTEKRILSAEGLALDQATAQKGILLHLLGTQRQVSALIAGETAKTAATVAGTAARTSATATGAAASAAITGKHNLKEITSHAASAAAAAYHAMAGIPVVGPVLGAAAAAATFSAVEAFGALASFDKGTNVLPADMLAQVHAGERIVPAADNAKLLELTARGAGANDNSGRGDMHLHYAPSISGHMPFADQLATHESNIITMIERAHRHGALKFIRR